MATKITYPNAYHIYAKKPGEKRALPISRRIWGLGTENNLIHADIFEVKNAADKKAFIEYLDWLNNDDSNESGHVFEAREVRGWTK